MVVKTITVHFGSNDTLPRYTFTTRFCRLVDLASEGANTFNFELSDEAVNAGWKIIACDIKPRHEGVNASANSSTSYAVVDKDSKTTGKYHVTLSYKNNKTGEVRHFDPEIDNLLHPPPPVTT